MFLRTPLVRTILALALAIKLTLPGHVFFGHEIKFRVTVTVPVDVQNNREVGVEWDGDGGAGYTSRQLDEYVDWTHHNFQIILRPGEYLIRGVLKQSNGRIQYTGTQTVFVKSDRPEDIGE